MQELFDSVNAQGNDPAVQQGQTMNLAATCSCECPNFSADDPAGRQDVGESICIWEDSRTLTKTSL